MQRPRLLLLDEPTSNLDLKNQLRTMGLVQQLCRNRGLTAVAAVHDLNLAAMFCDRFLMLKHTRLFACGGSEVLTPEHIKAVYDVQVHPLSWQDRTFLLPVP